MRKVKYISVYPYHMEYDNITTNKVYDVTNFNGSSNIISILDDNNKEDHFHMYSGSGVLEFIDVTSEYRSKIIDGILK